MALGMPRDYSERLRAEVMMADEDEWQRLLIKAKDGQLSERELRQVIAVIKDPLRGPGDEVRQAAVSVAAEFLRHTWNDKVFEALLDIATNERNSHEARVDVILALARAVGGSEDESAIEEEWHRSAFDQAFRKLLGRGE
jgi:hypothetical protein